MKPETIRLNAQVLAYKKNPTPEAERVLVDYFLPMTVTAVSRYLGRGPTPDELQEARIACMIALRKWNPKRNALFMPCLSCYVRKLLWEWKGKERMIRLPPEVRIDRHDAPEVMVSLDYLQPGACDGFHHFLYDFQRALAVIRETDPFAADVAHLTIEYEWTVREAATHLKRAVGSVHAGHVRALTRLREILSESD